MGKTRCYEKVVGLRKGRWSREEDEVLSRYIQAYGHGSWMSLPFKAGLLRCGKSCRLRWINYLRGGLKRGNFTHEEDEIIVKLHRSLGNRWSTIARHLPGRTDNEIKNYWNCHLRQKRYITQPSFDTFNMVNQTKRIHDRLRIAKSNNQALRNNSTCVNMIIKESQLCSNEINMAKVDEHIGMEFVLGGDVMDSNAIMKVNDENQTKYSLTKVEFDHFNMHASNVDYNDYENLSSNLSQVMGCFDENLVNDSEMGFGFGGFNVCDNNGMFIWPWN